MAWCNLNHRLWTLGAVIHGNIVPLSVVKPAEQPLILKTFWQPIVEFNAPNVNYAPEQQVLRGENAENFAEMEERPAMIFVLKDKLFVSIAHLFVMDYFEDQIKTDRKPSITTD